MNRLAALESVTGREVSRGTVERLDRYAGLLAVESQQHNLVSRETVECMWERHLLDGAQLVRLESRPRASWVDIGSGAGLPGVVIAVLVEGPVTLVEPRRLRADFLTRAVAELGLSGRVRVVAAKVERVVGRFDMITARAVASVERLLTISTHLSTGKTTWVLPKGRSAQSELVEAQRRWHCEAEIVASRTDPQSGIVVLRNVKAKGGR